MKHLLTLLLVGGLLVAVSPAPADTQERAACSHDCYSCKTRCRGSDKPSCERTCLEMKRACCKSAGQGPGPRTTCACT